MENASLPYGRVLLKLSGETLMGERDFGIDFKACQTLVLAIKALREAKIQVALVIGGGNFFRGIHLEDSGMQRTPADQMGMLATLMNGMALQQAFNRLDCLAKVMSGLSLPSVVDSYSWREACDFLEKGYTLIFVGGTGNPFFTTDTAAALRASEIEADILLKATKVDGVYDKDPLKEPGARKYETLFYSQALAENLKVMDATSIALCRASGVPILVFNMNLVFEGKIVSLLKNPQWGTLIKGD